MKKNKLVLLSIAAIMLLSLAACGDSATSNETPNTSVAATATEATTSSEATTAGETVNLADITMDSGLSMKLPSDMTLQDVNGTSMYVSSDKSELAVFAVTDYNGVPLSEEKEETYLTSMKAKYADVVMKRFENNSKIDGNDALIYEVSLTTPAGKAVTQTAVLVVADKKAYTVNFTYNGENDSFLAKNIQACIDSIKITPAK